MGRLSSCVESNFCKHARDSIAFSHILDVVLHLNGALALGCKQVFLYSVSPSFQDSNDKSGAVQLFNPYNLTKQLRPKAN